MNQPLRARVPFRQEAIPRQATDFVIIPPTDPPRATQASPRRPETLTEIFNRAAKPRRKPIVTKHTIRELEKKISRPTPTYDLTPLGRITGCYDPKRDKQIRITIKEIKQLLEEKQRINRSAFQRALLRGNLKREFNQRSFFRR